MKFCRYVPALPLANYVDFFWYYSGLRTDHSREHVLPDGSCELLINLEERSRKLFDRDNPTRYQSFHRGWLSGPQSKYLVIDVLQGASMMGVHFKPGGIAPFLKCPAGELCDQVVELDAVWGHSAWELREQLMAAPTPRAKFSILESSLRKRMLDGRRSSNGEQRVNWAVERFMHEPHVQRMGEVAAELGVSHKHFVDQFRSRVGLTPKLFCRIRRFQQVLSQIGSAGTVEWVDIAYSTGYFDQAHFVNDFQAFAGFNPTAYLSYRTDYPNFTRVAE
jgi:AraC-like DNA-binding protein